MARYTEEQARWTDDHGRSFSVTISTKFPLVVCSIVVAVLLVTLTNVNCAVPPGLIEFRGKI